MDFSTVYDLNTIGKRTALHVRPRNDEDIEDVSALYRARVRPDKPLVFEFFKGASGSTAHDFVSTGFAALLLVSNRVVKVLAGFTGWTTYPVEVYGKNGELIAGYHGLAVTGRCGPIDDARSRPAIQPPAVPAGRPRPIWIGLYFDPATWDGSDIFLPQGNEGTFVTRPVKMSLEEAKATNVYFRPLTEMENMSSALLFGESR
ncbi:MAG: hypothetical protein ACE5F9_08465 [Phycisphaerae bacterium]